MTLAEPLDDVAQMDGAYVKSPPIEALKQWTDALTDFSRALVHADASESIHRKLHDVVLLVSPPAAWKEELR